MNTESMLSRSAGPIRLAAVIVVPACLWFTQAHRTEALLCLPLLILGHVALVGGLTGLCAAVAGSVFVTYAPQLGMAAIPGVLQNAYFGNIRSGDVILIAAAISIVYFTFQGKLLAKPGGDPWVARLLPGLARPIRLGIASAWPMLPIVAVPFGLASIPGAVVWGVGLAALHYALWTAYGRVHPEATAFAPPPAINAARWRELALLGVVAIVVLAPFVQKPFHIDDPAYLWTAQQIVEEPLDFYGFDLYMKGMRVPMHVEMQNPPMIGYYLAAVSILTGWGEVPMHLASFAFVLAAVFGTYFLAQRFCANAWAAALAMLSAPGFFVSATTVMCDVPMIAFYVWAAYCWLVGYDRARHRLLFAAGVLIALAALTKYFGMTMIPLLFVYSVVRSGGLRARQLYLLVPFVALTAYELWTRDYYGRGLLLGAGDYVRDLRDVIPDRFTPAWMAGAMFAGGSLGTITLIGVAACRSRTAAIFSGIIVAATITAAAVLFTLRPVVDGIDDLNNANIWLGALFGVLSVTLVVIAAADFFRNPGPDSLLLGMWLGGSLAFCIVANWSVTTRALLPAVVPAAILMIRQLETAQGAALVRQRAWRIIAASACALLVGVIVARGDTAFARYEHAMAGRIAKLPQDSGTLWFDGRWGLEYYLRTYGAKTLLIDEVQPGDRVALPERAKITKLLPDREYKFVDEIHLPLRGAVHTMFAGAGFYSSLLGPLPYAFGEAQTETYRVYEVLQ